MRSRLIPVATALAVATSTALMMAPTSTAAPAAGGDSSAKLTNTNFAFTATGYGTLVEGGMVPADSGTTGFSTIACTNQAGKTRDNYIAEVNVPGLGTISGVRTDVQTRQRKNKVFSLAKHSVADVSILDTPLGSLSITGVSATSRVTYTKSGPDKGFKTATNTSVLGIKLQPAGGLPAQTLPLPTPDQPIEIPGLATISLGKSIEKKNRQGATAYANALFIHVIPTDTTVKVARSAAKLERGAVSGIFNGNSSPVRADVIGDLIRVGRAVNSIMPCTGTDGELKKKSAASVDLADQVVVDGAYSQQRANQVKGRASGTEESGVAKISLGGDALVIEGLQAKVNVVRKGSKVTKNGFTKFVGITAGGQAQELDQLPETIEIPGVGLVKLEFNLKRKTAWGMKVVALRITLLEAGGDDVDSVVNIGEAKLRIQPLGS